MSSRESAASPDGQLNIFDALASLNPTLIVTMEPEPGWVWARCATCSEVRYQRRVSKLGRCILTPGCRGDMEIHLGLACRACGRPVTARRRDLNLEFCSRKCEKEAAA